jgi:hypothetical protein
MLTIRYLARRPYSYVQPTISFSCVPQPVPETPKLSENAGLASTPQEPALDSSNARGTLEVVFKKADGEWDWDNSMDFNSLSRLDIAQFFSLYALRSGVPVATLSKLRVRSCSHNLTFSVTCYLIIITTKNLLIHEI